jgi:hypothetical protein
VTNIETIRRYARYSLAGIRLLNGIVGLVAPELLIRRLATDPRQSPAAIYAFRLFGIRTILLGLELLTFRDEQLQRALHEGVIIHISDALTSVLLGEQGQLPPRIAVTTASISAVNVGLALISLEWE